MASQYTYALTATHLAIVDCIVSAMPLSQRSIVCKAALIIGLEELLKTYPAAARAVAEAKAAEAAQKSTPTP